MDLSAVIIAKNEEKNLERLCKSLHWVDEIVVVDDHSTDSSRKVAERFHAKVISHAFKDFSSQFNLGLKHARGEWILSLDADEEIPEECIPVFKKTVSETPPEVGGFRLLRRNYVAGKWLKHGQQYGKKVALFDFVRRRRGFKPGDYVGGAVKLFRRRGSRFKNIVHQEIEVSGKVVQLQAYVNHYTAETFHDLFDKLNFSTSLYARQMFENAPGALPPSAKLILWIPVKTFFRNYFRKRGYADGLTGLIRSLADMVYEMEKYAKLHDYCSGRKN